jgi:putative ABC transport system ATP-binding protein
MGENNQLLKLVDIEKTFITGDTKIKALQKVNLTICKGEIVAIMGSSGSGKTTLLNVIGALTKPEAGEMYIEGRWETRYHKEPFASRFRRENIGFVFQDFNLLEELTVEENVSLPLLLQKVAEEKVNPIVEDKLRLVGLLERKKDYPKNLSGGQRQRVAIARALVVQPKLILADEPTGNLDYNTSLEIMDVFKKMNELENQTIMVVTHDPLVASFANRVLFFHDGIIINEYFCKEAKDNISEILSIFQSQYQSKKRV